MSSRSISLPFSIPNAYQGFAKAHGIATANETSLILEVEIKDGLIGILKSSNSTQISIDEVISLELQSYMLIHRLIIRTRSMALLSKIPGNKAGQLALWINGKDKAIAERFVLLVRSSKAERELNRLNQEMLELGDAGT